MSGRMHAQRIESAGNQRWRLIIFKQPSYRHSDMFAPSSPLLTWINISLLQKCILLRALR